MPPDEFEPALAKSEAEVAAMGDVAWAEVSVGYMLCMSESVWSASTTPKTSKSTRLVARPPTKPGRESKIARKRTIHEAPELAGNTPLARSSRMAEITWLEKSLKYPGGGISYRFSFSNCFRFSKFCSLSFIL